MVIGEREVAGRRFNLPDFNFSYNHWDQRAPGLCHLNSTVRAQNLHELLGRDTQVAASDIYIATAHHVLNALHGIASLGPHSDTCLPTCTAGCFSLLQRQTPWFRDIQWLIWWNIINNKGRCKADWKLSHWKSSHSLSASRSLQFTSHLQVCIFWSVQ